MLQKVTIYLEEDKKIDVHVEDKKEARTFLAGMAVAMENRKVFVVSEDVVIQCHKVISAQRVEEEEDGRTL